MHKLLTILVSFFIVLSSYSQVTCGYDNVVTNVSCYGSTDGTIELSFPNWKCEGGASCASQESLPSDYCSSCTEVTGGDVTVNSGQKYCIKSGSYNNITLNPGGEAVICETGVSINNINFAGGKLTVNADITLNQISINSEATIIKNYKKLTVNYGFAFKGSFYNYGTLNVMQNFNVNAGNHYIENKGIINFSTTFNNNFETVNYGVFNQLGGDFHNNSLGKFTNYCTVNMISANYNNFINDTEFHNYGTVDVTGGSRFNSNSKLYSYKSSTFSTSSIVNLDGQVIGDNSECSQLTLTGSGTSINGNASLTGQLYVCGYNLAQAPSGTIGTSVTNNCDCSSSGSGVTISWQGRSETENVLSNLSAGTYYFSASCGSCSLTDVPVEVVQPEELNVSVTSVTNESEENQCDGSATISIAGGTESYTISWPNGDENVETSSGYCDGTYTVSVIDDHGCTTSTTFTIAAGGPACDINFDVTSSQAVCEGNTNGFIEFVAGGTGGDNNGGDFSGCVASPLPQENYCASCDQTFNGSYASVSNGRACLKSGFNGHVDLNGGTLVICDDNVVISSINFENGEIIVLGQGCVLNNINMNNSSSRLINYGSITTQNITFNGELINHGHLFVDAHFNVNSSTASIHNTGEIIVSNNFVINTTTLNEGLIHVSGEYFIINGQATLDNRCTIEVGSAENQFGRFIDNGIVHNSGGISVGYNFRLNSGGVIHGLDKSILSTYNIEMFDGQYHGPSIGCTKLEVNGNFGYNSSMYIDGNVSVCGFDIASATTGTISGTVNSNCSCGQSNPTTTDSGIFDGFNFDWLNISGTTTTDYRIDDLGAGTYTVVVSSEICTETFTITIPEVENSLSSTFTTNEVSGDDACDNQASITVSAGIAPIYYEWYLNGFLYRDGVDKSAFSDLCSGDYKVVLTDGNGCQNIHEFKIGSGNTTCIGYSIELEGSSPSCGLKADGAVAINITGGKAPYLYQWNTGGSDSIITFAAAQLYIATVTDANNCVFTDSLNLEATVATCSECENTGLQLTAMVNQMPTCNADPCDGSITLQATGGNAPLKYFLNEKEISTSELTQAVCVGMQHIKVLDANACYTKIVQNTDPGCVTDLCDGVSVNIETTNTICPKKATGTATVSIIGGASPYMVRWNHGQVFPSMSPILYYTDLGERKVVVEIVDQNGCDPSDIDYVESDLSECPEGEKCLEPITIDFLIVDTPCENQEAGAVIATVGFPYTTPKYYWNDEPSTDLVISQLPADAYRLRVVDQLTGCFAEKTATVNADDKCDVCLDFAVTKNSQDEGACSGAGSVSLSANAGFGPYTIYIDGIKQEGKIEEDNFTITGLSPNNSEIKVVSRQGCTVFISVNFTGNGSAPIKLDLIRIKPESCIPGNDGEIIINYYGGVGLLTGSWTDDYSNRPIRGNLKAGDYEFTLADASGCSVTKKYTVPGASETIHVNPVIVDATDGCNGSIYIDELDKGADLSYSWSNITTDTYKNEDLCKNYYTVTITDETTGCSKTLGITIKGAPCDEDNVEIAVIDEAVAGEGGSATVTLAGCDTTVITTEPNCTPSVIDLSEVCSADCDRYVTGSNEVNVDGGERVCVALGTQFSGQVNVNDGEFVVCGNVTSSSSIIVDQGATLEINNIVQVNNITINSGASFVNNGSVNTETFIANGTFQNKGTIAVNDLFTLNSQGVGTNKGTLNVGSAILNGTLDYSCGTYNDESDPTDPICPIILWNPSGTIGATSPQLDCEDDNSVTITFCDGRSKNYPVIVDCYEGLIISGIVNNGFCHGEKGSIDITATGGTGSYSYQWFDASTQTALNATTEDITDLEAGTYYVIVTDNGSSETKQSTNYVVVESPLLTISAVATPTCKNGTTGTATALVTGGTGFATYIYSWESLTNSNFVIENANAAEIGKLEEGEYEITITDRNNCAVTETVDVEDTGEECSVNCADFYATAKGVGPSCATAANGYAVLTVSGGNGAYYLDNDFTLHGFTSGIQSFNVYEKINGEVCAVPVSVIIPVTEKLCPKQCEIDPVIYYDNLTCTSSQDGVIDLEVNGAEPGEYLINWAHLFPLNIEEEQVLHLENLPSARYEVTVTHKTIPNCAATIQAVLTAPEAARIYSDNFEVCENDPMVFTSSYSTGNKWSKAAGEVLSTERSVAIGIPGDYVLTIGESTCADLVVEFNLTEALNCNDGTKVFCEPYVPPVIDSIPTCEQQLQVQAVYNAQYQYTVYLEEQKRNFQRDYMAKCLSAQEKLSTEFEDGEYHYTLYYYDQSGNLTRTIPPAGVVTIDDDATIEQIRQDRINNTQTVFTEHSYKTTYTYNSLNQLIGQNVPDHETMDIFSIDSDGFTDGINPTWNVTSMELDNDGNGFITTIDAQGNGHLLNTSNHGQSWSEMSMLGIVTLHDVEIVDANRAVAVGDKGTYVRSDDGGENWIPYPVGTATNFRFVHFTSIDTGIVWSATGANWITTNGGETWVSQSGISGINGTIRDLRFYNTDEGVLLVQQNGRSQVFETNDGGVTWTGPILSQNIEVPELTAFHVLDAQHIVAVGNNGLVIKTIDGGNQWELIDNSERLNFTSIHMLNNNSGAALAANAMYKTTDGGNQWEATAITNIGFSEIKENGVAAFVQASQNILLSTSAGVSIQKTLTPSFNQLLAADVRATGLKQVVASRAVNGEVYISYNQGNKWYNITPNPSVGNFVELHQSDENLVLALTATGEVYRLTNAKSIEIIVTQTGAEPDPLTLHWEEITNFGSIGVSSLQFDDDLSGYAVLSTGALYQTLDGGATWGFYASSTTSTQQQVVADQRFAMNAGELFSFDVDDNKWNSLKTTLKTDALQGVYTNGTKTIAVGDNSVIVSTTNGISWTLDDKIETGGVGFESISLTASGIPIAVSAEGNIWQPNTQDEWTSRTVNKTSALNEVAILDNNTVYAVGNEATVYPLTTVPTASANAVDLGGIFDNLLALDIASASYVLSVGEGGKILKYNGSVWECVTMVEPLALNATDMVGGGTGFGVGDNGTVVKTTDGGQSWQNQNSSQTQRLNAVDAIDLNNVIAVGNNGAIVRTTNGGADNFNAAVSSSTTTNLYDIQMVTGSLGYAVGAGGVVLRTTNGGANWSTISSSAITEHLYSVHFVSANYGFVAGASGAVYLYNNGWQLGEDISLAIEQGGTQVEKNEKINDIYFVDNLTGYAITEEGNMYKTLNAGSTWEVSDIAGGNNTALNFIYPLNKNNFFVAGKDGELSKVNDETNLFSSKFWYDRLGRLVLTQDAQQFDEGVYSYILYDKLGRIYEVGKVYSLTPLSAYTNIVDPSQFVNDSDGKDGFESWLSKYQQKLEVRFTQYDKRSQSVSTTEFLQKNLRGRIASLFYYEDFDEPYESATHFSYDIHGNIESITQDSPDLASISQQYKSINYDYDLISGNVKKINYQKGEIDQFYHRYSYDSDNRVVLTETSRDDVIWDTDAKSIYYKHGPLARLEIGHNQVQAMDYNYTIHGWLKGVNATSLRAENDPGKDGLENNFAKDELAYNLNYYKGDYSAINQPNNGTNFLVDVAQSDFGTAQVNLYNGNISQMVTGIRQFMQGATGPQGMNYAYDQLNRLKTARSYIGNMAQTNNTWGAITAKDDYGVDLSYDPNGNILSLDRKGTALENIRMDEMDYEYETVANGYTKNSNRLKRVTDDVPDANYASDIDSQLAQENYLYDKIGNLVKDKAEGIDTIIWNVQGKIKSITKVLGKGDDIEFRYDAQGNRIVKIVKPKESTQEKWVYTYYVLDASGVTMAVYHKKYKNLGGIVFEEEVKLSDFHMYGSKRLGVYSLQDGYDMSSKRVFEVASINSDGTFEERSTLTSTSIDLDHSFNHYIGRKKFEGKNHLGNVLIVFTDAKEVFDIDANNIVDTYKAIVVNANDYYPFGSMLPDRNYKTSNYRYGFQGQEKDDEISGNDNTYSFKYRIHDARLGRFFTVDPLFAEYPHNSSYAFSENRLLDAYEMDGKEAKLIITDNITGYTLQTIYGTNGRPSSTMIVVPTYEMKLVDAQDPTTVIATYSVTRDAWYSRGTDKDGNYALTNRAFEPADGDKNLYGSDVKPYPSNVKNEEAFELTRFGDKKLDAVPFTKEQNTYLDGTSIDGARTDPARAKATSVMVHIGGYYHSTSGADKLAGSYGCFGFIPPLQTYSLKEHAQKILADRKVSMNGTTNADYQSFVKKVVAVREKYRGTENFKVIIAVEKRTNIDTEKTVNDESTEVSP